MAKNHTEISLTLEPVLLDRAGAAAALSISEDVLDKLRKEGLPSIAIPGTAKVVFDMKDCVPWLKKQSRRVVTTAKDARTTNSEGD